jgi:hypothetical protein
MVMQVIPFTAVITADRPPGVDAHPLPDLMPTADPPLQATLVALCIDRLVAVAGLVGAGLQGAEAAEDVVKLILCSTPDRAKSEAIC